MQKVFESLTLAFRDNEGILTQQQYEGILEVDTDIIEDSDTFFFLLQASGFPIDTHAQGYQLSTYFTPHTQQRYCVIDIETNGSKPLTSQVIEIGAVMLENGVIVDRFESFVECAFLPEYISRITGIQPSDLIDAPSRKEALTALRTFMGDAIFVAHNADFDYGFLNASFDRFGLGQIGNPQLCTIELARRTFESERYGLAHLIAFLEIETATHHRAFSDAFCAYKVMEKSFETLPAYVNNADELLRFAKSSKKERRLKREALKINTPAIIFAGGKSRRMGEDKALLPFGNFASLSEFQQHKLQKYFTQVYISAKTNKFDFPCRIIKDTNNVSSPLVGIVSIFETLDLEEVFILSVDAPFVDKKVIERLFEVSTQEQHQNDDVLVAESPSGLQPLCAIYRRSILPLAKAGLEANNHKLQSLLSKAKTHIVKFEEDKDFMNLNHKESYEKALLFDAKY